MRRSLAESSRAVPASCSAAASCERGGLRGLEPPFAHLERAAGASAPCSARGAAPWPAARRAGCAHAAVECAEPTRECRLGACSRCARSSLVSGQGQGWGQWSGSGLESGVGLGLARWTSSGSARGAMPGFCTAATAASTAAPQRSARFEGICQPILGPAGGRLGNPAGSCV